MSDLVEKTVRYLELAQEYKAVEAVKKIGKELARLRALLEAKNEMLRQMSVAEHIPLYWRHRAQAAAKSGDSTGSPQEGAGQL